MGLYRNMTIAGVLPSSILLDRMMVTSEGRFCLMMIFNLILGETPTLSLLSKNLMKMTPTSLLTSTPALKPLSLPLLSIRYATEPNLSHVLSVPWYSPDNAT